MSIFRNEKPVEQVVHIQGNVHWEVAFDTNAKVYIGLCRMLNLNAIGETWIDFQQSANDAMGALFSDLFQSGEFEKFMQANGWHSSTLPQRGTTPRFDMPFAVQRTDRVQELYAHA